jgi:hypothetical protein
VWGSRRVLQDSEKDEGLVVDSLSQAMIRVNHLQLKQFQAAIREVPTARVTSLMAGSYANTYPAVIAMAIDAPAAGCKVEVCPGRLQYLPGLLAARHP